MAVLASLLVSCVAHIEGAEPDELELRPSGDSAPVGTDTFACNEAGQPETVPLRRLTRYEYTNAIRALLSVDEVVGGAVVQRAVLDLVPIEALISALPQDAPVDNHGLFDASQLHTDESHVLSHFQVAEQVAGALSTDSSAYRQLVGVDCDVAATDRSICIHALLASFGAKVLRRGVSEEEHARYLSLYEAGASAGGHAAGIKSVVTALLNSPSFIFHLEDHGTPVAGDERRLALTSHEKATRLSFVLTGSIPDAVLDAKAASGELEDQAVFDREVERLLELPATKRHIRRFFSQWLRVPETGDLTALNPDFLSGVDAVGLVPKVSAEAHDFIQHIVWQQRGGLSDLLLSRTAFVTDPALARIYGVAPALSAGLSVELNGTHAGLLTRAALLLGSSEITSPIARGVRIRRHILCDNLPEPGNVEVSDAELAPIVDETLYSTRQVFEHRTSLSRCQACHVAINGLGFAFEGYDTLGRARSQEYKYSSTGERVAAYDVDTLTTPRIQAESTAESRDGVELSSMISSSEKAHKCLTEQWIEYSIGSRPAESGGSCFRARAYEALRGNGGGIAAMLWQTAREIHDAEKALDR